ncbi:hypothetical protein J6590_065096 [Homalodisca vitripennis]|nr:hypothetical protein J6590_065096 [Homalodisca vitripennis]
MDNSSCRIDTSMTEILDTDHITTYQLIISLNIKSNIPVEARSCTTLNHNRKEEELRCLAKRRLKTAPTVWLVKYPFHTLNEIIAYEYLVAHDIMSKNQYGFLDRQKHIRCPIRCLQRSKSNNYSFVF